MIDKVMMDVEQTAIDIVNDEKYDEWDIVQFLIGIVDGIDSVPRRQYVELGLLRWIVKERKP